MKTKLSFYYFIITSVLAVLSAYADDAPSLVGSLKDTSTEVVSATDIVIGKFTAVTPIPFSTMGGQVYRGQITILKALKGNESGSIKIGFSMRPLYHDNAEVAPNLNDTYIMILTEHQMLRKLLPATDANIAKVKALIAAAPVPK